VLPSARRSGVFRALYDHVDSLSRSTPGVIGLRLYVELDNATAQRTYERCGMRDGGYRVMEVDNSSTIQSATTQKQGD
jgi:ribosomal protein S18 acetylase RimI-like enzyme